MKVKNSNIKGLTLIEVILALALISIVLIAFVSSFSNIFINLFKSKDITVETFSMQESMEEQLNNFTNDDLGPNPNKMEVFGKKVAYKKITGVGKADKRNFVSYISKPNVGILPIPIIQSFSMKAYDSYDNEIYPWFESGTRLEAKYDDSNPSIFKVNYNWYESKDTYSNIAGAPRFSSDYDIIKFGKGIDKYNVTYSSKRLLDNELKNRKFYYYGITPYSDYGKLGKMAINDHRLLVIERTENDYWNSIIEDSYLMKAKLKEGAKCFTMNNINEVTLNVESDSSVKQNGPLILYDLPNNMNNDFINFRADIEAQFTEKALDQNSKEAGFGIFLGNYNNEKEDGIIFLIDPKENSIDIERINYNNLDNPRYAIDSLNLPNNFDWKKRYKWGFEIIKSPKFILNILYKSTEDNSEFIKLEKDIKIDSNFVTSHIGLKTWSDYKIEDEYNIEYKYSHNLTTDFYDIDFEIHENIPLFDENKEYIISSLASANQEKPNVFDISQSDKSNNKEILHWEYHGKFNQIWKFKMIDNGFYRIMTQNGLNAVEEMVQSTRSDIVESRINENNPKQEWEIIKVENGYIIKSKDGRKVEATDNNKIKLVDGSTTINNKQIWNIIIKP